VCVGGFFLFSLGFFQALWLISWFKPDLVLGTGGYASVSVLLAACLWRKESAICEQNSIPGLTNRILGKFVKKVFIAFEESDLFFPRKKIVHTGNPVRKEFLSRSTFPGKKGDKFTLLILGGSQGARSINQAIIECLDSMAPLRDTVEIIHQTGFQDFPWVKEAYEKKGFNAHVAPFITDMASVYGKADVVVSRAGAITITEILVSGKPSVLIPYPYAAYNHQEMNAKSLVDKGAAQMILDKDLKDNIGDMILHLINHPEELKAMGDKAKALARPDAARVIIDHYFPEGDIQPRETKGGYDHL
jgi:UDP-N-acetylglucosamine--N-acetylmuramyl-(pentapeptide) pyrophosphoryl-undecaprenol N-acetylglucosamine transferase